MKLAFGQSKELEAEIENLLFTIQKVGMIFNEGMREYVLGDLERFQKRVEEVSILEREADDLRRDIKHKLYIHMLIPDARGDVLGLLETMDEVVDECKHVMQNFCIERPHIYEFLKADFIKMIEYSQKAVEEMAKAANSYFTNVTNIKLTNDFIHKVYFYEHEVDNLEKHIKGIVFTSPEIKELACKIHLRYFIEQMARVSDATEVVCERLSISVIKRSM